MFAIQTRKSRNSPEGEPRSRIVDAGPLHMHHRPRAGSSRRQRAYGLREMRARTSRSTRLPRPRSPPATALPADTFRWFRASAASRPDDESGRRRRQGWRSDAWQCTRAAPAIGAIEASPKEASVPSGSDASCWGEAIVSRDTRIHAGEQVQHSRPSSTAGWQRLTPLGLPVGTAVRRVSPPAGWWR